MRVCAFMGFFAIWQVQAWIPVGMNAYNRFSVPTLGAENHGIEICSAGKDLDALDRRAILSTLVTAGMITSTASLASAAPMVAASASPQVVGDALVWGGGSSKASCIPGNTRSAFGPKFINYLARFLLAYDTPSRRLWRARAAEIPLNWNEQQVEAARITQFGEFVGAVEVALCDFSPSEGAWSNPLTPNDAASVRRLLSLLRSRYGGKPDALRQLALLFSLLSPGVQPTSSIEQLAAEQEDREALEAILIDRGSFVLSPAALEEGQGLSPPALPLPAAPLARQASLAAVAGSPKFQASGRVLDMVVTHGGAGYDDANPPAVSITAPQGRRKGSSSSSINDSGGEGGRGSSGTLRAAQAKAVVKGGAVVALVLVDQGEGYSDSDRSAVVIAPPPKPAAASASVARPTGSGGAGAVVGKAPAPNAPNAPKGPGLKPTKPAPAAGRVLLEYEVESVPLLARGAGYGSSQDLDLRFFGVPSLGQEEEEEGERQSKASRRRRRRGGGGGGGGGGVGGNFKTPTAQELAAQPWSLEAMALKYGDRAPVAPKSTSDVLVLREPKATLVLGKQGASSSSDGSSSRGRGREGDDPLLPKPPSPPAAPRDQQLGTIGALLALLPPSDGAPIFDPGRPPSAKEPLGVPPRHRFPSLLFERINEEDFVQQASLGKGKVGTSASGGGGGGSGGLGLQWGGAAAEISALPTSISGGVKQDVPLRPALVARLTLAGGLCSAATRAVTSPLDLRKTRAQAAAAAAQAAGAAVVEVAPPLPAPAGVDASGAPADAGARGGGVGPPLNDNNNNNGDDDAHAAASTALSDDARGVVPSTSTSSSGVTAPRDGAGALPSASSTKLATSAAAPGSESGSTPNLRHTSAPPPPALPSPSMMTTPSSSNWLGLDTSVAAGFALGAGSFGTFEFLKRSLPELAASTLGPAAPAAFATPILLSACVLQAVVASFLCSPFETCRAKVMAGGGAEGAPSNLVEALVEVMTVDHSVEAQHNHSTTTTPRASADLYNGAWGEAVAAPSPASSSSSSSSSPPTLDVLRLWDGLPALLARELPFGVTKLLAYAFVQDSLLALLPAARERPVFALAVSLASGLLAGLVSALVSHPADTVVTRVATGGFGSDLRGALEDVLRGADTGGSGGGGGDASAEAPLASKARVLFAGVGQRCASMAIIVTAQFILFDGLRALLAVSKEDLSLVLDVFQDRMDFYAGWDEVSGSWIDAVDNLDSDLVL